ncbi:MAG: peptidase MA family metallohydrolase [Chloroflexi bacterium]|nr:peptidase MA family metallohydrolase [Chloroflexota bacterium]
MNRALVAVVLLLVLACVLCAGAGVLLFYAQAQPVAQATLVPFGTPVPAANTPFPAAPRAATPAAGPTQSSGDITVSSNKFSSIFPANSVTSRHASSSAQISQVALYVAIDGVSSSTRQVPDFDAGTQVAAKYDWNLNQSYLPPGVTGVYWWTVQDQNGGQLQTAKVPFRVDDPAHDWHKLSNDKLALYWYAGGNQFGQALFDRGVQAMQFLQQDTGVSVDRQIQVFIYGTRSDFFDAVEPGASEWTGGQAYPEYGIVLIDIEPSNLDWGLGATTHELTHQVIHQKIKSALGDLSMPHWMDEGLAVYYQTYPGKLDAQFAVPLRRAIQNDTLQPLRTLSGSFPADSTAANLSYAESYSVVDFIIRHYGRDKLAELLQAFKAGGYYDDIFDQVLGVDTDGLENAWRQDVGAPQRVFPTRLATTPTPFPTFSLSTDTTPTPGLY